MTATPPFDFWRSFAVAGDVAVASLGPESALQLRRARRLAALLDAAARGSRLYGRILNGRAPADWRLHELPAMGKTELMENFADWVTDPALHLDELRRFTADPQRVADPYLGRYLVWESSGSSGQPAIFVQDAGALAVYDALESQRRPMGDLLRFALDPLALRERIAFVGATGGHYASVVSIERLRRLNPAVAARVRCISFMQPAAALCAELRAAAPTVLATYPSAAVLLAEETLAGRLRLPLKEVWTGGETLTEPARRFVQDALGCRVANSYGASEFLTLAAECGQGRMHLNSDWAILEPVDEHGRPVPVGCVGATTLLTNLANHVQPLIRYDLGDRVAVQAQRCACGSRLPVIDVEGRRDDTLRVGRVGAIEITLLPLALSTVLEDHAGLFDFQLEQCGCDELVLRTGMDGPRADLALQRASAALTDFLELQGAPGIRILCRSGEPGRPGPGGKIQRIIGQVH